MTTACSLRDLVISGLITDDLCAALSSLAAEARLLREENRLRLCAIDENTCETIRRDVLPNLTERDAALVPAGLSLKNFRCAFFDMDSTLMHRRTCGAPQRQGTGRANHRALDARRTRFRTQPA